MTAVRFRFGFALAALLALLPPPLAPAAPANWSAEIDALTHADATHPPAPGGIVFVGSSSIRLWATLAEDFPGLPVIRRGFGGSELADSVFYADRIVLAYRPRTIVLYAGENDISAGKAPEAVAADFEAFRAKVFAALPRVRLIYLAMKPSPSRWAIHEKLARGNALIAAACARDPRCTFVDVWPAMLDTAGQPRHELFREDRLHMNHDGYLIWARLLAPLLERSRNKKDMRDTENTEAAPRARSRNLCDLRASSVHSVSLLFCTI